MVKTTYTIKIQTLRSLRISRNAARLSRRRWTSMSKTSPSWSSQNPARALKRAD